MNQATNRKRNAKSKQTDYAEIVGLLEVLVDKKASLITLPVTRTGPKSGLEGMKRSLSENEVFQPFTPCRTMGFSDIKYYGGKKHKGREQTNWV